MQVRARARAYASAHKARARARAYASAHKARAWHASARALLRRARAKK
jgi:hypothetical protein